MISKHPLEELETVLKLHEEDEEVFLTCSVILGVCSVFFVLFPIFLGNDGFTLLWLMYTLLAMFSSYHSGNAWTNSRTARGKATEVRKLINKITTDVFEETA